MKILVVDDEYKKIEELASVIRTVDSKFLVQHATTAREAREKMQREWFDLIVVDLNLPSVFGDTPTKKGGLDFVRIASLDKMCFLPESILFITEHEDELSSLRLEVMGVGGELYQFIPGGIEWKAALLGKLKYASNLAARRKPKVDVIIVAALRKPELSAILELPYEWNDFRVASDPTLYHLGSVNSNGRTINLAAAATMRKGMASSAALASKMIATFRPKVLLMPGICAGRQSKVSFGDIVIADPVWDWGSGKRVAVDGSEPLFLMSPHQISVDSHVSQVLSELACSADTMKKIRANFAFDTPQGSLSAHIGPLASGASVLADGRTFEEIQRSQNRDVIAVDMEAYAIMEAASYTSGVGKVKAVAIKSVCDYGDGSKNDDWQKYAAYTSAAFVHEFITSPQFCEIIDI